MRGVLSSGISQRKWLYVDINLMTKETAKLEHHHRVPGNQSQSTLTQKVLLTPELFHTLIQPKASYCNLETASKKQQWFLCIFPTGMTTNQTQLQNCIQGKKLCISFKAVPLPECLTPTPYDISLQWTCCWGFPGFLPLLPPFSSLFWGHCIGVMRSA